MLCRLTLRQVRRFSQLSQPDRYLTGFVHRPERSYWRRPALALRAASGAASPTAFWRRADQTPAFSREPRRKCMVTLARLRQLSRDSLNPRISQPTHGDPGRTVKATGRLRRLATALRSLALAPVGIEGMAHRARVARVIFGHARHPHAPVFAMARRGPGSMSTAVPVILPRRPSSERHGRWAAGAPPTRLQRGPSRAASCQCRS
jgi:hypothetical protein